MELFRGHLPQRAPSDIYGRLAALEDYVEYLRQQGEYGADQAQTRLTALEGAGQGQAG